MIDRIAFINGLKDLVKRLESRKGKSLTFADVMDYAGQTVCSQLEEDNCGQLVIYTGWKESRDGTVDVLTDEDIEANDAQ